jgi:hypothetical protein
MIKCVYLVTHTMVFVHRVVSIKTEPLSDIKKEPVSEEVIEYSNPNVMEPCEVGFDLQVIHFLSMQILQHDIISHKSFIFLVCSYTWCSCLNIIFLCQHLVLPQLVFFFFTLPIILLCSCMKKKKVEIVTIFCTLGLLCCWLDQDLRRLRKK